MTIFLKPKLKEVKLSRWQKKPVGKKRSNTLFMGLLFLLPIAPPSTPPLAVAAQKSCSRRRRRKGEEEAASCMAEADRGGVTPEVERERERERLAFAFGGQQFFFISTQISEYPGISKASCHVFPRKTDAKKNPHTGNHILIFFNEARKPGYSSSFRKIKK